MENFRVLQSKISEYVGGCVLAPEDKQNIAEEVGWANSNQIRELWDSLEDVGKRRMVWAVFASCNFDHAMHVLNVTVKRDMENRIFAEARENHAAWERSLRDRERDLANEKRYLARQEKDIAIAGRRLTEVREDNVRLHQENASLRREIEEARKIRASLELLRDVLLADN